MRYVFTLIWATLIGAAITYVLSSMANDPFNLTQMVVFTAVIFFAIIGINVVLGDGEQQS